MIALWSLGIPVSRLDLIRLSKKLPFAAEPSYKLSVASRAAFDIGVLREFEVPGDDSAVAVDAPIPSLSL